MLKHGLVGASTILVYSTFVGACMALLRVIQVVCQMPTKNSDLKIVTQSVTRLSDEKT